MKNIHLLPTEKPSKLFDCFGKLSIGDFNATREDLQVTNQHIYITSDEKPKKDEWVLYNKIVRRVDETFNKPGYDWNVLNCKKIILTTDQDLIADGVQAIDDKFLEWFVKNPGCEFVEWSSEKIEGSFDGEYWKYKYGTVIPQEEPKYIEDEFEMQSRIINKVWDEEESKQNLRDKLELLVEEWKKRQIYYEDIAQDNTAREHTYKKFTYKAMATRDCLKELLILLNESKNE
jgi:hypothetical protein